MRADRGESPLSPKSTLGTPLVHVDSGTNEASADLRARLVQDLGDRLGPAVTMATTEHFNLQTARAATISEANGRASIYLAAVSSNLIALAFIGQMSLLGTAFYAFSLLLLPVLAFVGVVTFQRLVQSSLEDIAYAQRIARLRSLYVALAPELEPYLLVARGKPVEGLPHGGPLGPSSWQLALTTAGMVAVMNSVVIGASAGLVVAALGYASLAVTLAVGAVVGATALAVHRGHHQGARDAYEPDAIDRFATLAAGTQTAEEAGSSAARTGRERK
jgi:ribose/xylose/arabinose/galactoside ABC-type transport system permease subunit